MFYDSTWAPVLYRSTAALSIFGSSWIIIEVLTERKKRELCYHRLHFCLSFFDVILSTCFLVGSWAQTDDDAFVETGAVGNKATCYASGFVIYLGSLAIPWYNTAITTYYYLAVCRGWKEQQMKKNFERYVHMIIFPVAIITATIPLFLDLYGPFFFYCFVSGYDSVSTIFLSFYLVSVIVCSTTILITMILIMIHVRKTSNRSAKYSFSRNFRAESSSQVVSPTRESRRSRRRREISSEVTIMALLYTIPFVLTWLLPVLWFIIVYISMLGFANIVPEKQSAKIHLISFSYLTIFIPLQGFFHWLVYMRPRLKKILRGLGISVRAKATELVFWCCLFCFQGSQESVEDQDEDYDFYVESGMEIHDCSSSDMENAEEDFDTSASGFAEGEIYSESLHLHDDEESRIRNCKCDEIIEDGQNLDRRGDEHLPSEQEEEFADEIGANSELNS